MSLAFPLLGVIELEYEPLSFRDLFNPDVTQNLIIHFLQNAGGFATIGLLAWILVCVLRAPKHVPGVERPALVSYLMWIFAASAMICYAASLLLTAIINAQHGEPIMRQAPDGSLFQEPWPITWRDRVKEVVLAFAGLFALMGFCEPLIRDMFKFRWGRIWAIAKLSFKEAIRRRVVWVFLAVLLVWLFPANWFRQIKPEYELITHINIVDFWMSLLLYLVALMAAFAIPTDVKNQTIHTVVTKPVERFEIVLGRFLGYFGLVTIALFLICTLTLFLISTSNIDETAKAESMKARMPLYGELTWFSKKEGTEFGGINVGKEKDYRKYLAGGSSHRAFYNFTDIPSSLSRDDRVPVEFGFDIYRTTKGIENRGVGVSFDVTTWKWDPKREAEFEKRLFESFQGTKQNIRPPEPDDLPAEKERKTQNWQEMNRIAEDFGRFLITGQEIADYHTSRFDIPPGIIKNALEGTPPERTLPNGKKAPGYRLMISVRCDSPSQFIGVAKLDLYVLEGQGSFWVNFYKGGIGLWCRLAIITLLGIVCSTYLAGVISFLIAAFLFIAGSFKFFIFTLAIGANVGGGPAESLTRLVRGDLPTSQLDQTTSLQVASAVDEAFRWVLRRFINMIPDIDQFDWFTFVAHGFSIRIEEIFLGMLFMAAYMLPWFVLAYYLMRSREIAA